jgi:predicted TIM-barrel fold metal-dependent hydrolase
MKANHTVNTREPYRIDVHHHVLPKFYLEALERVGKRTTFGVRLPDWSLEAHLEVMDRNKIAVGMASTPTVGIDFESDPLARGLARQCNEFLAQMRSEHPTRFGAFAVLPMPDVDAALVEATYALDALKLDGVVMLSNVARHYVGDPENDALFAELNRRNTVVYIHPSDPPDEGIPASILFPIDTALETVRAAMSLLYGGVFERYPKLKFIFSHCGGITPYLAHRMVRGGTWVRGEGGADPGLLDEPPNGAEAAKAMGHLQRQYYDSMTANAANGLRTLQAFVDPSHILLGTDHAILPAKYQPLKMREQMRYQGFDDATRLGVERGNALRLFPRLLEVL